MSSHAKRKPDKFINMIPHRECVYCYTYKPSTEFYINRTITKFGGPEEGGGSASARKVTRSSYCQECDNKYIKNKGRVE